MKSSSSETESRISYRDCQEKGKAMNRTDRGLNLCIHALIYIHF